MQAVQQTPVMSERLTSMLGAFFTALGSISMSLYTPAMPTLERAFHASGASVKLTLTFYFAGFALAQLVTGPASDVVGRRKAAIFFLTIYGIGSVMAVFAPGVEWIMAARLIQGIGASVGATVSRALVRDQFSGEQSSRIMNMIGIMLAIGPGLAPTIGGLILAAASWQGIFVLMAGMALAGIGMAIMVMKETTVPDPSKARPMPLIRSYASLISSGPMMSAALTIGFAVGAIYMLATILPFVLIDEAGLTPTEFGMGMLAQTGSYFVGSLVFRYLLRYAHAGKQVVYGLGFILFGSLQAYLSLTYLPISYLSVMVPVAFYAFGVAFVMPHMTTAALAPFPRIAGTAAALLGFIQMGSGFVGGLFAAWLNDPVLAFHILLPGMGILSTLSYIWHLRSVSKFVAT